MYSWRYQVLLSQGLVGLIQRMMQAVHCDDDLAANVQSLRALLAAYLVHAGEGRVGPRFEIRVSVVRLANLLRRRPRGR